jgi:hypothetical protein
MPAFEVTAVGFDGSTDATDDHVLWVWCRDEAWLLGSLSGAPYQGYDTLDMQLDPNEYDFIMPKDVQALHDRLRALAGIPLLGQVERGDTYRYPAHPEYGDVTLISSDPDDGAYLICKYWCAEDDEQKYFGCEASDLRFIRS